MVNTRGTGVRSCSRLFLHDKIVNHCQWLTQQWSNGGGGRGQSAPPETSDREIFADVSGKNRQEKKGKGVKIEKKRKKIAKGIWKLEMEVGKVLKRGEDFFFIFHFSFFFFFFFN